MRSYSDKYGIIILFFDLMQASYRVVAYDFHTQGCDVFNVAVNHRIRKPVCRQCKL